jgi:hypothetical protein
VAEPDIERRKITDLNVKLKEKKRKWKEGKKIGSVRDEQHIGEAQGRCKCYSILLIES